ncbi:MAG: hypothetical protein A3F09_03300 [Chlamydiae bacterium RIFCSPHIGHO2_12_FULL_49_11]|nr:MAG: hypothetical protein A3F09_03300 [Chlamydiae bacterium RIFCSPHIGHO2_12_FULL_49_11]
MYCSLGRGLVTTLSKATISRIQLQSSDFDALQYCQKVLNSLQSLDKIFDKAICQNSVQSKRIYPIGFTDMQGVCVAMTTAIFALHSQLVAACPKEDKEKILRRVVAYFEFGMPEDIALLQLISSKTYQLVGQIWQQRIELVRSAMSTSASQQAIEKLRQNRAALKQRAEGILKVACINGGQGQKMYFNGEHYITSNELTLQESPQEFFRPLASELAKHRSNYYQFSLGKEGVSGHRMGFIHLNNALYFLDSNNGLATVSLTCNEEEILGFLTNCIPKIFEDTFEDTFEKASGWNYALINSSSSLEVI